MRSNSVIFHKIRIGMRAWNRARRTGERSQDETCFDPPCSPAISSPGLCGMSYSKSEFSIWTASADKSASVCHFPRRSTAEGSRPHQKYFQSPFTVSHYGIAGSEHEGPIINGRGGQGALGKANRPIGLRSPHQAVW